jgi:predicted outer membrane repeat protein
MCICWANLRSFSLQAGCARPVLAWYCCFGGLGVAAIDQMDTANTRSYSCAPEGQLVDSLRAFASPSNRDTAQMRVGLSHGRRAGSSLLTLVLGAANHPAGITLCVQGFAIGQRLKALVARYVLARADAVIFLHQQQTESQGGSAVSGGVIEVQAGTMNISSSRLNASAAQHGGAVAVRSGSLAVSATRFEGNIATDDGGAIMAGAATVRIFASDFAHNRARVGGAVACTDDAAVVEIKHSTFSFNFAEQSGGAISIAAGAVTMYQSSLSHNFGGAGAAISVAKPKAQGTELQHLNLDGCVLQQNGAQNSGLQSNAVIFLQPDLHDAFSLAIVGTTFNNSMLWALIWRSHTPSEYSDADAMHAQPMSTTMRTEVRRA